MKQPTYSRAPVQFHFRVPSARLIILRGEMDGDARAGEKRRARRKGKMWQEKTATYSCEKQKAGTRPASGSVSSSRWKGEGEERQKIERKKWDEVGTARGKTEVLVEGRNITPAMLARHRDVLQLWRRFFARFIGWRAKNLCGDSCWQVVLLAMKNRNFSLTLLSPSSLGPSVLALISLYTRLGWIAGNWRGQRDVLLNAINI